MEKKKGKMKYQPVTIKCSSKQKANQQLAPLASAVSTPEKVKKSKTAEAEPTLSCPLPRTRKGSHEINHGLLLSFCASEVGGSAWSSSSRSCFNICQVRTLLSPPPPKAKQQSAPWESALSISEKAKKPNVVEAEATFCQQKRPLLLLARRKQRR